MAETHEVQFLELSQVRPNTGNVRTELGDLTELTDSIRRNGIYQHLVVRPHPSIAGDFEIVMGHRRYAAAKEAGVTTVPCVVREDIDSQEKLIAAMLTENIQRSDITKSEEGRGYQQLLDLGMTTNQVARRVGKKFETVDARVKLAGLGERARTKVDTGAATLERAAKVAAFQDYPELEQELEEVIDSPVFDWKLREADEKRHWMDHVDGAYEKLTKIGFQQLTAEEVRAGDWQQLTAPQLREAFPADPEKAAGLEPNDFGEDVLESIDDYAFVLSESTRAVKWYQLVEQVEATPVELTAEELAEQEAREKATTALRISRAQFADHMRDTVTKPTKVKGAGQVLVAREMADYYHAAVFAAILGVAPAPDELSRDDAIEYYAEKFQGFTVDQLMVAKLMYQLDFEGSAPAKLLFDFDFFSPAYYRYRHNEQTRAFLEEYLGWAESEGESLARAFWEPTLPESADSAGAAGTADVAEDEVNF